MLRSGLLLIIIQERFERQGNPLLIDIQEAGRVISVPATKQLQGRDEKRSELVATARRLFLENGFEATSMSALARAAGVAANTIYWYFTDKDDVLVAVLDSLLDDALVGLQGVAHEPLHTQLLWVVDQLRQMRSLVNTVHARSSRSPTVSEWHDGFHAVTEALFRAALEHGGLPLATIDADVSIGVFTIEGLLTHDLDSTRQQGICQRLAEQWTPT